MELPHQRKKRPLKIRNKDQLNPLNVERNNQWVEEELQKIYENLEAIVKEMSTS